MINTEEMPFSRLWRTVAGGGAEVFSINADGSHVWFGDENASSWVFCFTDLDGIGPDGLEGLPAAIGVVLASVLVQTNGRTDPALVDWILDFVRDGAPVGLVWTTPEMVDAWANQFNENIVIKR